MWTEVQYFALVIGAYSIYFYWKRWTFFKNIKNIDEKPMIPLIGHALQILRMKGLDKFKQLLVECQ